MRFKYLGEFNDIKIEDKDRVDESFLDADKIVMVIPTGEVVPPPQASPEDTLPSLEVRQSKYVIFRLNREID